MPGSLIQGNALSIPLKDKSVQLCCFSPPYFSLRKYTVPDIEFPNGWKGQMGSEPNIDQYLDNLMLVMAEVKRILRDDGVVFVNIGDIYSSLTIISDEYILRDDLTKKEKIDVSMDLWRYLQSLWAKGGSKTVQGHVPKMLSKIQFSEILLGPKPCETKKGKIEKISPRAQSQNKPQTIRAKKTIQNRSANEIRREMRLLRGDRDKVFNFRSHQQRRSKAQKKTQRSRKSSNPLNLQRCGEGGLSEGQVQSSLLELQLCYWAMGRMSSPIFKKEMIPQSLFKFFKPKHILKPKSLCLVPQKFAIRCQEAGWIVRSEIILSKVNPLPEAINDRPAKSHEQIWMLTKQRKYFFDQEAVKEKTRRVAKVGWKESDLKKYSCDPRLETQGTYKDWRKYCPTDIVKKRNIRSVWTMATEAHSEAHFATWSSKLVDIMVRAGSSPKACELCGAPWERAVDYKATGWKPTCTCTCEGTGRCVVADIFCGIGTSALVAERHGRFGVGMDLSSEYLWTIALKKINTPIQKMLELRF